MNHEFYEHSVDVFHKRNTFVFGEPAALLYFVFVMTRAKVSEQLELYCSTYLMFAVACLILHQTKNLRSRVVRLCPSVLCYATGRNL